MLNENISVFYASDENYSKPLAVSIASVLANTAFFIDFYILDNGISDESKKNIETISKIFNNFSVKYVPINIKLFENFPNLSWYSLNMYSRFLIPEIEPYVDKAIYLDVDIVLKSDIKNLFDIDLEDCALGAVVGETEYLENPGFKEHIKSLGLSYQHTYFGSGVLVLDTKKWRKEQLFEKLIKIVENKKSFLKYPDQDVLNILFDKNYKKIDLNWNRDINCLKKAYENDKKVVDRCFLIHYDSKEKPWNSSEVFASSFWHKYHNLIFPKSNKDNSFTKYQYTIDLNDSNVSAKLLYDFIIPNSTVLDVGCSVGSLANLLYKNKNCKCYGFEYNLQSIDIAKSLNIFSEIRQIDLDHFQKDDNPAYFEKFDYIIFGDVLEHLKSPETVIENCKSYLKPQGQILISLPNISHASVQSSIFNDDWTYMEVGILDETHIKFYTKKTISEFLSKLSLKTEELDYTFMPAQGLQSNFTWLKTPIIIKNFIKNNFYSYVWQFVIRLSVDDLYTFGTLKEINDKAFAKKYQDKHKKYSNAKQTTIINEKRDMRNYLKYLFFKNIFRNPKKCRKYQKELGL